MTPVTYLPVKPVSFPPVKHTVDYAYAPIAYSDTHSTVIGYLLWIVGFTGAHRFYFGKPLTGILWFFTFGLLGIGWLVDVFLIPSMDREADRQFLPGPTDYSVCWILLVFFGWLGLHRLYQGKVLTGLLFALTGGLLGIGIVYDVLTINEQISEQNEQLLATRIA
jgi:TM2 domain-containing membrane protein YozV